MFKQERQQAILDILKEKNTVTVSELSKKYYISETSIRRDLIELERLGFIKKIYSGAILIEGENDVLSLEARQQRSKEAKAIKASKLINNGDVLFLDSSSSVLAMTPYLAKFSNITHSLKIAANLASYPHIKVYCVGGLVSNNIYSCNGTITYKVLSGMHADKCFISPKSVHQELGVYCANEEEAAVRNIMIKQSEKSILLCHTTKLYQRASFRLCGLDEIDIIVCDEKLDESWQNCFAKYKIDWTETTLK